MRARGCLKLRIESNDRGFEEFFLNTAARQNRQRNRSAQFWNCSLPLFMQGFWQLRLRTTGVAIVQNEPTHPA
jgi:hypothetical protein